MPHKGLFLTKVAIGAVIFSALFAEMVTIIKHISYSRNIRIEDIRAYEKRFDGLRKMLPPFGTVGYISGCQGDGQNCLARFYVAQYAIAPAILVKSTDCQFVVANFDNSAKRPDWNEMNLTLIEDFRNGVMLFAKGQN
jgi:hypothetical protein